MQPHRMPLYEIKNKYPVEIMRTHWWLKLCCSVLFYTTEHSVMSYPFTGSAKGSQMVYHGSSDVFDGE